jgi:hypothetical protein
VIAWTVLNRDGGFQAFLMTRFTVGAALGPAHAIAVLGEEAAYRLAETDGAASGLPYLDSCQPHPPSSVATGSIAAQTAAAAATARTRSSGPTYAASYGTSVIETPPAQPPAPEPTSPLTWSPSYGKGVR